MATVRYEILDAAGQLLWRSRDVDEGDVKTLEVLERSILLPEGATVLTFVDGRFWPQGLGCR